MHVIVLKLGFKPNQCPCVVFLGKTLSAMCNFVAPLYRNVMVDKNLSRTLRQLNTFSFQFLFSKIKEKRCKKKKSNYRFDCVYCKFELLSVVVSVSSLLLGWD